jgi:ribosome modulation factor
MVEKLSQSAAGATNLTGATFRGAFAGLMKLRLDAREARAEAKERDALVRNEHKRIIKDLGVNKESLALLIKVREMDGDEAMLMLKHTARYGKFMNMPMFTQTDMFKDDAAEEQTPEGAEEGACIDAEQTGYYRGVAGDSMDENPHQGGLAVHVAWHKGWKRGNEFYKRSKENSGDAATVTRPAGRKPRGNPAAPPEQAPA